MTRAGTETELDMVVVRRTAVAEGVVRLDLADPSGATLPEWSPGAHIDLILPGDLVRQFSLCSNPADRSNWSVAVLREVEGRGGSAYVHGKLSEGDAVRVRGPRNNFPLVEAGHYVFVAGGIGVTPIVPMLAEVAARGAGFELLYGGRTRASMAFSETLAELYGGRVTTRPQDEHGLLDLVEPFDTPRDDAVVYCCGPESLLNAVEQNTAAWPAGSLHLERFTPKELSEPVRAGGFGIELARSGMVLEVPAGRSIVEILRENDVPITTSCEEGTCGSCETAVLEGEPEHRDSVIDEDERESSETMMLCVSRAVSDRLVLDL